jgi:hypothetical protein
MPAMQPFTAIPITMKMSRLGDLPAGVYQLNIIFDGMYNRVNIQILPGQVTYFTFNGFIKYNFSMPPTPTSTVTASPKTP